MLAASPLWGVMEPGYMPAGKQTIITGLRLLPRDDCSHPRNSVPAYGERKARSETSKVVFLDG